MIHRALGSTGLRVAPIGLGTVKFGRTEGLKLATPPRLPSDDQALQVLRTAHTLGINLIDTAPAYGTSEERLGLLLPRIAPADSWILCTKAGEQFDGQSRYDFSSAALRASVDRSLTRLRRNALDIVLLHFSSATDDASILNQGEALAELKTLRAAGKVRAVGASTSTLVGTFSAIRHHADVVMLTLNQNDHSHLPAIEAASAAGVGVLVKKALAGGRINPSSALPFVLGHPGVACAVIGTTSPANLASCVASANTLG